MGHAHCGGIKALLDLQQDPSTKPLGPGNFIGNWIKLLAPAAEKIGPPVEPLESWAELLARESIRQSLRNLRSFPYVNSLEKGEEAARE